MEIVDEGVDGDTKFIYSSDFSSSCENNKIFEWLEKMDDFEINTNFDNTKIIRQQKWYQTGGFYFCPKWESRYNRWKSFEYTEEIKKLQRRVQQKLDEMGLYVKINSCLINKYRDGKDKINAHKDTHKSFGHKPVIVVVSVGDTRKIKFNRVHYDDKPVSKRDKNKSHLNFEKTLENNSIFIMTGCSQMFYTHEIPESESEHVRYSLTFREFLN
jgi:alkylated DNA repair dioxygenase AlkB